MAKKQRKAKKSKRQRVLADHQLKGKVFLPPFLAKIGKLEPIRWIDDILPELLWIALLFEQYGESRAVDIVVRCAQHINGIVAPPKAKSFAFISDYFGINEDKAAKIREALFNPHFSMTSRREVALSTK